MMSRIAVLLLMFVALILGDIGRSFIREGKKNKRTSVGGYLLYILGFLLLSAGLLVLASL